ncbi:MAG: hypothetical protein WCB31_11910 [Nitrososphaeraceae archaeon]|jgi:hypothetical protein
MYSRIPSVSHAIREILYSNSLYINALETGIANYTALAIKIKPEVEKLTKSQVNINTIVVGIKRLADLIREKSYVSNDNLESLKGARISLTGSILDVDFGMEIENMERILDLFDKDSDIRFNIFQTKNHIKLFVENINEIKKIFRDELKNQPDTIKEGISMINITLPWSETEFKKTYQLLSMISNILYTNQILLHNAFFTPNEIVLIISEGDAAKAYELLRIKLYK